MLVDQFNNVIVTNDGVTILENMEASHPAARMVINLARAQKDEVGDGTTTATLFLSALVGEGAGWVMRGVPVTKVIEGIRDASLEAVLALESMSAVAVESELLSVALVAGRGCGELAEAAVGAAIAVGVARLAEPGFRLADTVLAQDSGETCVVLGVVIDKVPMSEDMPRELRATRVLVLDDALEPDDAGTERSSSDAAVLRSERVFDEHRRALMQIVEAGVGLVVVDRGVSDEAAEVLSDAGVMVVRRVSTAELHRVAGHTGARLAKRSSLRRSGESFERLLGSAERVWVDERSCHIRVEGGGGCAEATILVGGSTKDVASERERMARDAASSVQAAATSATVPGGGAAEIAALRWVAKARTGVRGMSAYGWECVLEALRRPLSHIVLNCGFNPLEKLEDAIAAQQATGSNSLSLDSESGEVVDMVERGILDPLSVKVHAIRGACAVATAILRISTIVRKREGSVGADSPLPDRFS